MLNHVETQELKTDRLILRRFVPMDAQDVYNNWTSIPEISKYMRWTPHKNLDETKGILNSWIKQYDDPSFYRWAVCLAIDNQAIGSISLFVINEYDLCGDVAYCLSNKFWGKGIITEALKAVLSFAFNVVGFNRIETYHSINNPASGKVMQKAGMVFEGFAKQKYKGMSGFEDCNMYAIVKEELNMTLCIEDINNKNKDFVISYISKNWGSSIIVTRGMVHDVKDLPGFVALVDGEIKGIIIYSINDCECEIITLASLIENRGVGSLLMSKVAETARENGCRRIWLITTNDNINAIRFYQKRGYDLVSVHRNAIAESRKIKPQIPLVGFDGIPIRHEVEFEFIFA